MNNKKLTLMESFQSLARNNLRTIIILIGIIILLLISFQIYIYMSGQKLKKTSIEFFNILNNEENIIINLEFIENGDGIYSILSQLKLVQLSNKNKNYNRSNDLYKKIINTKKLDNLYLSAIATQASYTMINASYDESTNRYLNDISIYISKINDGLESYGPIKKELEYLKMVTEIDVNNLDYKNNNKVLELYDKILNSSLISSSIKERVKKIHEFQLYK